MCLIIHKPKGETIPEWVVESALEYNCDGFGVMHGGKGNKYKNIKQSKVLEILTVLQDTDCAIHFRMATDGIVNKSNAHPFKLNNQSWLMHNGILSKYRTDKTAKLSDTRKFVETFCNPLISKHGSIPKVKLEEEIFGSTVCIMLKDGNISRYGSGWSKHEGCYFSNEYAWDSPTYANKYGYASTYDKRAYPSYIDDDYSEMRVQTTGEELAETMVEVLELCTDILPFNDISYISYEDIELQDEYLDGEITGKDFLEYCNAETLLQLYTWAATNQHIAY